MGSGDEPAHLGVTGQPASILRSEERPVEVFGPAFGSVPCQGCPVDNDDEVGPVAMIGRRRASVQVSSSEFFERFAPPGLSDPLCKGGGLT